MQKPPKDIATATHKLGYNPLSSNFGFFLTKIPLDILNLIKPEIDSLSKNFDSNINVNEGLVGEIQNEFEFNSPKPVNDYIYQQFLNFEQESKFIEKHYFNSSTATFVHNQPWVNFQKPTEYNPLHHHTGVISWVIWYQIPYTFEEQQKFSLRTHSLNGYFSFLHATGEKSFNQTLINTIPLISDNRIEGHIAIFPSSLDHIVYPFSGTKDKYRITIAGNMSMVLGTIHPDLK